MGAGRRAAPTVHLMGPGQSWNSLRVSCHRIRNGGTPMSKTLSYIYIVGMHPNRKIQHSVPGVTRSGSFPTTHQPHARQSVPLS